MANASGIFGILTVQVGGNRDEHPLTKPVLNIGRSSENDLILLDDPQISRHHLRLTYTCLLYTSPSPRDRTRSRMPSSA